MDWPRVPCSAPAIDRVSAKPRATGFRGLLNRRDIPDGRGEGWRGRERRGERRDRTAKLTLVTHPPLPRIARVSTRRSYSDLSCRCEQCELHYWCTDKHHHTDTGPKLLSEHQSLAHPASRPPSTSTKDVRGRRTKAAT